MKYSNHSFFHHNFKSPLKIVFVLILFYFLPVVYGQKNGSTIIKGRITDSFTNEPIQFAAVFFVKTNGGTSSDTNGFYRLTGGGSSDKVQFSCLGYESIEVPILAGQTQTLNIRLKPKLKELTEVVVKPQKKRYSNKDNFAVDLINQVIAHKDENRKEQFNTYSYEKYEKTQFAISNLTEEFKNRRSLKKFKFIFKHVDTTKIPGNKILPIYLKETLSDFYARKSPKASVEVIKANKMVTFEKYLNNQGMTTYLKYIYQDINIYDENIMFLTNLFLSPIAHSATAFYRFFIIDTLMVDRERSIKMLFAPRNKTDMLFQGYLYVTCDSNYAVKKIELSVPTEINLNWAKEVRITQDFTKINEDGWMLTREVIGIDFGLTKDKLGIYGERSVSFQNIALGKPLADSLFHATSQVEYDSAEIRDEVYWKIHRHQPLTQSESGTISMIDSVKRIPVFKNAMNIMFLLLVGYRDLGNFEIGPVNTFYSYNPTEGYRVRFGGRTTDQLSKRVNFETYIAYGFTDTKVKYYLGTTISLTKRSIFEFPVKSIRTSYQDDTKIPGQELQFVQESNFLLSFKRGVNNKILYNKTFRLEHFNEFNSHFSIGLSYQFLRQRPGGDLYFNRVNYLQHINNPAYINISEFSVTLRYAPKEQFYQGKQYRMPMPNKYPITQLQLTYGSQFYGNDYNYLNLKLSISKRFYLSVIGYTDVIWEGGKIFGQVPFPLLYIHRANQTYGYQIASYNLMNFLEFVSDEYTSLNFDHCFNGFFFNKIPLIKKLKWREHITAKILFGRLTPLNNPAGNPDLFRFPVDDFGRPVTFTLDQGPYIEVSAGIANILKIFRVEFVKRVSYLYHPVVSDIGIRLRYKFNF